MCETYIVEGSLSEWFQENRQRLYSVILEAAESSRHGDVCEVSAFKLRNTRGVTEYTMRTPAAVVQSLRKCETAFVEREDYELAARSRDCGIYWNSVAEIYIEKSQT